MIPKDKDLKNTQAGVFFMILIWRMVRDFLGTLCLWGIRNDFAALCLQNLLIVEPNNFVIVPNPKSPFQHKQKMPPMGHFLFVADGEGFEPPDELPRQRFSRPSHSTALPTILNHAATVYILLYKKSNCF